jgi:hypothetical protein
MGAVRIALHGGAEDVFTDELLGGGPFEPRVTVFDFGFEVSAGRALTVTLTQRGGDRRYSPYLEPLGSIEVARYAPTDWVAVTKE